MKMFFISKNYSAKFIASAKAKIDCEIIAWDNGFKNIGLERKTYSNLIVGRLYSLVSTMLGLINLPLNSTLLLQYPTSFYSGVLTIAKIKHAKVITIIHDLNSLRGFNNNLELKLINKSDIIIAHNDRMIDYLVNKKLSAKFISLEIFDYLAKSDNIIQSRNIEHKIDIIFAGNLGKSSFISQLGSLNLQKTQFKLYGIGFELLHNSEMKNVFYKGFYNPEELIYQIRGTFGLVWDGSSLKTCDGPTGKYLIYNNPHKLSLYLLCELPVLVWSKSASAKFVTNNNIGFAIDSLDQINQIEKKLTEALYNQLVENVRVVKKKIQNGYFLSKALFEAINSFK